MSRWVVVMTDETGLSECFGTWRDYDKARAVSDALAEMSGRYGGEGGEFEVDIHAIRPWPGIRTMRKDMVG